MTPLEIKETMCRTPWNIRDYIRRVAGHGETSNNLQIRDNLGMNNVVDGLVCEVYDGWNNPQQKANALAIVTAVNTTYGKGYNPEYTSQMGSALFDIRNTLEKHSDFAYLVKEIDEILLLAKMKA